MCGGRDAQFSFKRVGDWWCYRTRVPRITAGGGGVLGGTLRSSYLPPLARKEKGDVERVLKPLGKVGKRRWERPVEVRGWRVETRRECGIKKIYIFLSLFYSN